MAQQFNQEAMEAWLTIHNPSTIRKVNRPELFDAINMSVAPDNSNVVISQACVAGSVASAAKANSDWASNPALGAVNCIEMAQHKASYNPGTGASSTQYNAFLNNLVRCPLFTAIDSSSQTISKTGSDWNKVINAVTDTFVGVSDKDKSAIVQSIKNLVQAASGKMSTSETEVLFIQNVLNVDDVITYCIYSSKASFIKTPGKGYDTKQNFFDVTKLVLQFQTALWPQYCQKIKTMSSVSFDEWIKNNSTSIAGTEPVKALS